MISRSIVLSLGLLSCGVTLLAGQGQPADEAIRVRRMMEAAKVMEAAKAMQALHDPLARVFFPPELVLRHAEQIGLRAEQRTGIVNLMKVTHAELLDLQVAMTDLTGKLEKEVNAGSTVNESALLAQIDGMLTAENRIKRLQVQMLIRIKNILSKEQQDRLVELRKAHGSDALEEGHLSEIR